MLAISTTQHLSLIDPQTLRRPPSSLPSCLSLLAPTTASAWSSDNLHLFLASSQHIHQYNPTLNTLTEFYSSQERIEHLVCKAPSSLVFATADKVHVLESTKVVQTFASHKAPITSLALSNDLVASTSQGAAHIHNLSLGSHTVLRGLNLTGQRITTCAWHPHSRAKLLLGVGKQLIVYDTTRPSSPMKTIPMNDATTDIIGIACSPFSKTLVAVASSSGHVGLVDLDKEKALFRTLTLKVPLTAVAFSPEGASIYLGTENGRLLIMDLRALDKPPKTVIINEDGCRVETMSVQKKSKGVTESSNKPTAVASTNPTRRTSAAAAGSGASVKPVPKVAPSPSTGRIARVGSGTSPARRPSALSARQSALSPKAPSHSNLKVFSPVRDPLGNSASIGDISVELSGTGRTSKKGSAAVTKDVEAGAMLEVKDKQRPSKDVESISAVSRTRSHVTSATSRTRKTSTTESALAVPSEGTDTRRPTSSTRTQSASVNARSRSGSVVSRPGSSASQRGSIPPVPPLPANSAARSAIPDSRTPSPDLPGIAGEPMTPLPIGKKTALTFRTPEENRWMEAGKGHGKGKGKTVVFKDGNDENVAEDEHEEEETQRARERSLSMQISPRRPSSAGPGNSSNSWAPSPLRGSPGAGSSSAHELLRTIVQDVMFDFQQEQRKEMVGLHLDLVRMGRGWKQELRELWTSDLKELRDENKRLRDENELLRRGY